MVLFRRSRTFSGRVKKGWLLSSGVKCRSLSGGVKNYVLSNVVKCRLLSSGVMSFVLSNVVKCRS